MYWPALSLVGEDEQPAAAVSVTARKMADRYLLACFMVILQMVVIKSFFSRFSQPESKLKESMRGGRYAVAQSEH
jgi:hypothetical protein